MKNKERMIQIYKSLLRTTKTYADYISHFQNMATLEQVDTVKNTIHQQILSNFYFFNFYPEDCLQLAYHDKLKELNI